MAEDNRTPFEILNDVNVNEHTEVKDTGKTKLTYLSWAWAWAEVKKRYPTAVYEIVKFNGLPYVFDEKTGYMVYTTVTIDGITHEMWLPVMDGNNRAMLDRPYEVQTKYNKFTVNPATMFDINKTIMRCLTKNLAMFGLGLYIYAGEDLPENTEEEVKLKEQKKPKTQQKAQPKPQESAPVQPNQEPVQEQTEEDPEITAKKLKYQELIEFCRNNKLDLKKIAQECNLTKQSKFEDFELALIYARSEVVAGAGGEENA